MANDAAEAAPRKVYVELTTECNLDCVMCMRRAWEAPGGRMSSDTFAELLRQLRDLPSVSTVSFGGYGEPTSHPRFYEFLARAKDSGLRAELVTNGVLLDGRAIETLVSLPLDKLIVSVDGISASASERLHAGPFEQVSAVLRLLYDRKRELQTAYPEVCIEFVATRRNIHELPRLKGLAQVLGFSRILATNLVAHTPELVEDTLYQRWSTVERQSAPASPYNPCVELPLLDDHSPASAVVARLRDASTHLRVNGADVWGSPPRCPFVTQDRLAIRHDGSVSPCLALLHTHTYYLRGRSKRVLEYVVGDVNAAPLKDIWTGAEYRAFRERVRNFNFSSCLSCSGCDMREGNVEDCTGAAFPRCGECLWALGLVQCP